ncbi:electron transfer flavoprotein subunit beta/FixA family protein [Corynebacterium liangguodongii]|uniref:Electron transfer flavoprotein subunit beta n=1 Tax=Corynebacterium liangguodongii TaxID=2079535 RepID=A0A2S0WCG3_9CORY|nr:electron transfer flavoprotein subunit beta/FixA family protein [Corynebacterium liangguodongii]AWB83459.1 electron transfer flavoprotein subunit beta [Corynebacterium liangguodongii]PWC00452.1 electron transfer flavoprotein subunit beta/FixA family protein [Corynebacterium liangguodongii]
MRIAVLVKDVPDTYGERGLDLETGLTERSGDTVLDEIAERAVEAALVLAEAVGEASVHLISVGPEASESSVRRGLAMGADAAVLVSDAALAGADLGQTAEAIAAVLSREEFDLVVAGNYSTDGNAGVVPTMVAELLGYPQLTNVADMAVSGGEITATRTIDDGRMTLSAQLPAVVSVTEAFPEPRYPNFKGLMAAKKKPVDKLTLADLGIDPEDFSWAKSIMLEVAQRPPREAGTIITDDGSAAEQLADYLAANRLI